MVIKLLYSHRIAKFWMACPLTDGLSENENPDPVMQTLAPGPYEAFWEEDKHQRICLHLCFEDVPEATAWMLTWL